MKSRISGAYLNIAVHVVNHRRKKFSEGRCRKPKKNKKAQKYYYVNTDTTTLSRMYNLMEIVCLNSPISAPTVKITNEFKAKCQSALKPIELNANYLIETNINYPNTRTKIT